MKFAILGAGSLGLVVAGRLAKAGNHVVVVAKPEQAVQIRERGVEVLAPDGFRVPIEAASTGAEIEAADWLIVVVKTRNTMQALDRVAGAEFQSVASLQNGVVKDGQLAERFGWPKVVGAASMLSATLLELGRTQHSGFGVTFFGELDGTRSDRVDGLVVAFSEAGMRAEAPASIVSAEWSKLCQVVPAALLSSLSRLEYYRVCKSRDLAELFVIITRECADTARACGVKVDDYEGFTVRSLSHLPYEDAVQMILDRGATLERSGQTGVRVSMLQDLEKGRKTEIEETAGYLVKKAREHGVSVPNLEFACRVVRGIEAYL